MIGPLHFSELTLPDLKNLNKDKTLILFPVGALEDFGPHLPIGFSSFCAESIAEKISLQWHQRHGDWTTILMPAFSAGPQAESGGFALTVRPYVLRDWLIDSCLSLLKLGFYQFACYSGTASPRHLTAIEEASKSFQNRGWAALWKQNFPHRPLKKCVLLSLTSALVKPTDVKNAPFFLTKTDHGGENDTSMALLLSEKTIAFKNSLARCPIEKMQNQPLRLSFGLGWIKSPKSEGGYWGSPAIADPQKAKILLDSQIEKIISKMEEVLIKRKNPQFVFRSWYSILPPNQSYFKAWVLFIAFFVIFSAWITLVVQFSFPEI